MAIGVENQFIFDLQTELGSSIINANSLQTFTSIESGDLLLPTFKILFLLNDIKNLSYFNEGAMLKLAFGKDKKTTNYINLQILNV